MPADIQLLSDKLQEMKEIYEEAIRNGKYNRVGLLQIRRFMDSQRRRSRTF